VGLVFQNYALFPHLTVFENVAFGLRIRRTDKMEAKKRVSRVLELVGLPDLGERYPEQLSGGQQQRIAIARSLVLEPRLLLLDEPLSNLDLKLRIQMRRELRNLQQKLGKTSIYVTHDQSEALALSDRIAVLSHGMIEQIGTPVEIYESPGSAFVADFIGNSNIVQATIEESRPKESLVRTDHGLRLRVSGVNESAGSRVMIMLRPEKFQIVDEAASRPEGVNHLAAQVETLTYLGEDIQFQVLVPDDERLLVSLKSSGDLRRLKPGDPVILAISPEEIHLLSR
jgi:ABC-type Fe3+/spermidine/putrescine transport system ATPase subunit